MDEKTTQMIEALKRNPAAVQSLFGSSDGQALLRMLTQGDRGAALQQAAQNAARGNSADLIRMVSDVMKSPEGADLIARINRTVQK